MRLILPRSAGLPACIAIVGLALGVTEARAARLVRVAVAAVVGPVSGTGRHLGTTVGLPVIGRSTQTGQVEVAGFWRRLLSPSSDVADWATELPTDLGAPTPNPSRGPARFSLQLQGAPGQLLPARVEVVDVGGRRVRLLVDGPLASGAHPIQFDGRDDTGRPLASGIYFARLLTGHRQITRKLTLAR